MKRKLPALAAASLLLIGALGSAPATTVTLQLVDSFPRSGPFGLAFDGTFIHYSDGSGTVYEMTTSGINTGVTTPAPVATLGALGYGGGQLAQSYALPHQVNFFDVGTGGNVSTVFPSGIGANQHWPIDGLDIDHNEIWYSPDQGDIYRLDAAGNPVGPNPVVPQGIGGYSGIERIDVGANTYLIDVNDGTNPRTLDVRQLNGTLIGQTVLPNARYEDLAFDGQYLYAADLVGNKIDKIDVLVDGGSIFVPVPQSVWAGLVLLAGLGVSYRRSRLIRAI